MKRSSLLLSALFIIGQFTNQAFSQQAFEAPRMAEQAMDAGRASGICATYEKMFKYARETGRKEDMDFAKSFFAYSANDLGKTSQGFLDFCKDAFAASARMQGVIDKYK